MKYKLTITQTTNKTFQNERGESSYDDRQSIVYESDNLGDLLFIIQTSETVNPVRAEYCIEKVAE